MDQCVITRQIKVAARVFAPGHLRELTQIVPFELVDQALAATGTTQARLPVLPSRAVIYPLLARCLFAELGYRPLWHKLIAGLGALPAACPSDNALWQARTRLGAAPLRWLFDLLRGPATAITAGSVRWHRLLVCAMRHHHERPRYRLDLAVYRKQAGARRVGLPAAPAGGPGACGTRTIINAVFSPVSCGEQDCTRRLARSLHAGMIVLLDRNFDVAALIGELAATQADLLVRIKSIRKPPVLRRYRDGSFLSQIGSVQVRVIECEITIATSAGRHTGVYRRPPRCSTGAATRWSG